MADESSLETRMRVYERSRETVRRVHERAEAAVERAGRMRDALQRARIAARDSGVAATTATLLQLAADETARVIQEKERLLAVLSHELKQPVNAALAAAHMLDAAPEGATADRARAILQRQLQQLSALIDALSDMSRLTYRRSDLRLERLDVDEVLKTAVEGIEERAAESGLALQVTVAPGLQVEGDRARLQQVFTNLLANAVRYTTAPGRVEVTAIGDGTAAVVTVRDTGKGISPEHLPHVFEPFARGGERTSEGFGLGLALVRSIVEAHGGRVMAESPGPGRGSLFTIRVPLAGADPSRAVSAAEGLAER